MLRAILLIVALIILVVIGLAYFGIIGITQTQEGQAPKFGVEVRDVDVGTTTKNVQLEVPTIRVGDGNEAAPAPAPANTQ